MGGEALYELTAAIRAHPRFSLSMRAFVADYIEWRTRLGVLNKVISNFSRERLLEHVLFLHYATDGEEGERGATFERLAEMSARRDQTGARAVRSTLRLSQIAGLLHLTRSTRDARLRIYAPTEALLGLAQEHYAILLRVIDDLAPRRDLSLADDFDSLTSRLARLGRMYPRYACPKRPSLAPLPTLLRLDGAHPILLCAIDRHWRGGDLPTAQEFSRRFFVSPSQTRAILKNAEAFGLIRTAARGRIVEAGPLAEAYVNGHCRFVAFIAKHGLGVKINDFAVLDAAL